MTEKELKRFKELEDQALDIFISNSDYSPIDWIREEDKEEYLMLWNKFMERMEV